MPKLNLDMSRGKPCVEQLALSDEMLALPPETLVKTPGGIDTRNYSVLDGIDEMKTFLGKLLDIPAKNISVGGNSSLNLMFDAIARNMIFGVGGGGTPWGQQGKLKWICPVPGYDRHFSITELFGFEMVCVPMTPSGPDMDMVEQLVKDPSVKGMWNIPKYQNPTGITYSDETVSRIANLNPSASDFRVFWDNAYFAHDIYETGDNLLNVFTEAEKAGNQDMVYIFTSLSKVTFPGAAVSCLAASDNNLAHIRKVLSIQTIGTDKVNQLRHLRLFDLDTDNFYAHMKKLGEVIRPKFDAVLEILERRLKGVAIWTVPSGGYFVSVDLPKGTAKSVVAKCKEQGVIFTPAGATFPYGADPNDSNIRIAPTVPPLDELTQAMEVFCDCVLEEI